MIFSFSKSKYLLFACFLFSIPGFVAAEVSLKEATYYSDSFQGSRTANGDIFDQKAYSAAICGIPLGQYLYVSKGNTGVVVDANDRPNCSRFPNVIDLSSEAFGLFAPLSAGRIDGVNVTVMGSAPTDIEKTFLPLDSFRHLGVILSSTIPTVLFAKDSIEIRGRVTTNDQYVLLYAQKEGTPAVNTLVKVAKDKTFKGFLTLPDATGETVFIVASGNSFDTDKYATISLISPTSLSYPNLPTNSRAKIIPKVTYSSSNDPIIRMPSGYYGDMEVRQGRRVYKIAGSTLLLKNTPLSQGKASVKITGYKLSTPSPLDRSISYPNLFSGTVLLERSHDTIGAESVIVQAKLNNAKFRFKSPTNYRVRSKYYLTSPKGEVKEFSFPSTNTNADGFLLSGIPVVGSVALDMVGTYMLEIVREDGIAFANIPITNGQAWPVIEPLSQDEISTIRTDILAVRRTTMDRINLLRNTLGKYSLKEDISLTQLAQAKVDDMIRRGYQGHRDPDGNYVDTLAEKLNLSIPGPMRENIGYGTVSDLSLQDGLEESGVHLSSMLCDDCTKIGIGYAVSDGKVYLVQIFSE